MASEGTEIKKRLKSLRDKLERCIEPQYGFLTKLVSSEVLIMDEFEEIDSKGSTSKQCVKLLNIMQHKKPIECAKFIDALIKSKQKHVANYISQNGRRFHSDHDEYLCWPLQEIHRKSIENNLDKLVQFEDCKVAGLSESLYSKSCINLYQNDIISEARTSFKRNEILLRMLLRRSIRDYNVFLQELRKIVPYWAELFDENKLTAAETFDFTLAGSSAEPQHVRELDNKIATGFRTATQQDRECINGEIHQECHPTTELVAMEDGHSIRCFFVCGTPEALQFLYDSVNNKRLITTIQSVFQQLLGPKENIFVVKITGLLDVDEQKKKLAEFRADIGYVETTTHLEDLSQTELISGFKKMFWFHYDVLEPLLLQVAIKLFKINQVRLLVPRPDVVSMLTISSVCKDWFDVITGRRILRRKLKTTFRKSTVIPTELFKATVLLRHRLSDQPMTSRAADVSVLETVASVCRRWWDEIGQSGDLKRRLKRKFHYNPQLLTTLSGSSEKSDGRPRKVKGVVMLENRVYVVYDNYNKVEVFYCEDCYKKVEDIEVEGMEHPQDMVGSSVTSQLFIRDWRNDVIRRVYLKTEVSDVFIELDDGDYAWLSLVENRLWVTSRDSLLMYDIYSGESIKNIPLTGDWKRHYVYHVIESNKDSFFVSHRPSGSNFTVSEIDSEGRVIRVFNNEQHFYCGALALDSVGRLLVIDYNNNSVVLLDENLKFKRILIDNKRLNNSPPWTLNYNNNNNRLAVGLKNGQVKIFECNK